jgi:7-cyano-7-deazaguanine synthase in queuosine biosynthesis
VTKVFVRRRGTQTDGCPIVLQAGANLQTGETKFKTIFRTVTTLEEDLLLLAASIFAVDRCVARGEREDVVRGLEISIPVVNISQLQPLGALLEDILRLLSNDAWRIIFRHDRGNPEERLNVEPTEGRTLLFSGGLDSLAAAIELGMERIPLQLVSHTTRNPRTAGAQHELASMLRTIGIDPPHRAFQVTALSRPPSPNLSFETESSQRTRSFLFLTLAVLCARRVGHSQIVFIAENGQMAIHLPLTQARIGAFSTHTAHPEVLAKTESFFSQVFRLPIRITNPYVHRTKAEVTRVAWDNLRSSIASTISCWKTSRLTGEATHCGSCIPCIVRRIAIEIHGQDTTVYERNLFTEPFDSLPEDDEGRRNLADFGEFVCRVERYSEIEMMTEWPDLYCPQIIPTHAIQMYKRAAHEARMVLSRYPRVAPVLT